jgi:hypothetical protein
MCNRCGRRRGVLTFAVLDDGRRRRKDMGTAANGKGTTTSESLAWISEGEFYKILFNLCPCTLNVKSARREYNFFQNKRILPVLRF